MSEDLTGQLIKHFRLEKRLGEGGMGTVYKAHDTVLERPVAVKLMHPQYAVQPEFRERLKQEARAAAQLEHPSIVRIYETGEGEQGLYIIMEYVSGGSLRAHMRRLQRNNKALNLENSLQIGIQIAEALDYSHREGMVHRDVKPGNIILRPARPQTDGEEDVPLRAILTDFGLVKVAQTDRVRTQTGLTMGTPAYMSPEQCQGLPLDGRSDLYSLGVVLYELVTNRPSFDFRTLSEALTYHIRGDMPDPPSRFRPEIPKILDRIILKLLEKEREDRYHNGTELAQALEDARRSIANEPTIYMMKEDAADQLLAQAPKHVPQGYFILIEGRGDSTSHLPLDKPLLTVGRGADNDVVLVSASMSRKHMRFQATEDGWAVVDYGGLNGTTVNGRRVRPNELVPINPDSIIEIAGYVLTLQHERLSQSAQGRISKRYERPDESLGIEVGQMTQFTQPLAAAGMPQPPQQTPSNIPEPVPAPQPTEPLSLYLTRERLPVEPGHSVTLGVEVVNHTAVDDRVSIRIHGLPSNWLTLPDGFVDLRANDRAQFKVTIRPPKHPNTAVGSQRFRIEVISQRMNDVTLAENATLLVGEFYAFEAQLKSGEIKPPDEAVVTIHNRGNVQNAFKIDLPPGEQTLRLSQDLPPIAVPAGQSVDIGVPIGRKGGPRLFGEAYVYDYDLRVISRNRETRLLSGGAKLSGLMPPSWAVNLGILTVVVLLVAVSLFAFRNTVPPGGFLSQFGFGNPEPTPLAGGVGINPDAIPTVGETPIIPAPELTATAQQATVAAIVPTATADLASTQDSDGDGLSNAQETTVTFTDPFRPDTDGDGLSDGQEISQTVTDPLLSDTDGDGLSDSAELFTYRTDPRRLDTDGDGINDKVEIDQGTNPLEGSIPTETPVPQPSETAAPPTATSEAATAAPSETPPPTSTTELPTETVVPPTETATLAPTATATLTPTLEPTPTVAAPTETPTIEVTATTDPGASNGVGQPDSLILSCATIVPQIDGVFAAGEWPAAPSAVLLSDSDPTVRFAELYVMRDPSTLYLGMVVNGQSADPNQSIRFLIDSTNDGGDPDVSDRFIQISRDGNGQLRFGRGSNDDGNFWINSDTQETDIWSFVTTDIAAEGVWISEVAIDINDQLPILASSFGLGAQASLTSDSGGDQLAWPDTTTSMNADKWADVANVVCTAPGS